MKIAEPTELQWKARSAHGRNIARACKLIARKVGYSYRKKHGANWIYQDIILEIVYDDYGSNIAVTLNDGKYVLSTQTGNLNHFNPYPIEWCKHVMALFKPLYAAEIAEQELQEREERLEHLRKWGFAE